MIIKLLKYPINTRLLILYSLTSDYFTRLNTHNHFKTLQAYKVL